MKYTDKIVFSDVKGTGINLNTGLPIFSRKYVKNEAGEIESTKPVINAVDIDWNGAILPNKNVEINSSGDLLDLIDNINTEYSDIILDDYATTEYVDNKVADLINMAPETLDTLGELAEAVENSKSLIDSIQEIAYGKASTEYVDNKVASIEIPSVDGLASTEYVDNKIDSLEIPSIEGLASEQYVKDTIHTIVGEAPETLDTIQELAYAVKSNEDVISILDAAITDKAETEYVNTRFSYIENLVNNVSKVPGERGFQGYQGAQGYRGFQGFQGIKGDQGDRGFQGYQGERGFQGEQGMQGYRGFQGYQGAQGYRGFQGPKGEAGVSEEYVNSYINNKINGLASSEYVDTKVAYLVNMAPETLDTLGELAEAVTYNKSVIESLTNIASSKASTEYVDNKVASIEIPSVDGLASEDTVMAYMEAMTNKIESLEIPSVDGLASTEYVDNKVGEIEIPEIPTRVSEFENDANYLTEHQDLSDYVTYEEYNELYNKFEALQQYVDVYLKLSDEELAAKNAAIISSLSADNTSVELPAGEVSEINLPEATKTYKVTANLADDTVINLTSSKAASIINTADNVPNVTIIAPKVDGATTQAPNVSLKGDFDTLTIENISVTNVSGGLHAPTVHITVNNLVVSENTSRPVRVNAAFNEGATVTNNSSCDLVLQNLNAENPTNVTVVAPQSTVTLYGTWQTLETEVGDNTLIINPAARIDRLIVKRGNVLVKSAYVEDCINSVVNDPANYTEAPQNESGLWEVSALVNEVGDLAAFKKVATTPSLIRFTNDIANTAAISYGIITSGHIVYDLNGHTYSTSGVSKTAVIFARGSNLTLDITGNGSIIGPELDSAYGIWLSSSTATYNPTVNIYSGTIIGATHTLYVERGTMNIYGGTFKMYELSSDKDVNGNFKFMLNCYDENFRNGTAHINVYGGTFWDFNPAEAYGEPGAPVSYVADGYHVEMTTVVENEVEHKVYTVVQD